MDNNDPKNPTTRHQPPERISKEQYRALQGVDSRNKRTTPKRDSKAEFLQQIELARLPAPISEYKFHPWRQFRFDWAYPEYLIAIEYQGGLYDQGKSGHNSIRGILRDLEKITEAQLLGWIVILIEPKTVKSGQALKWLENALALRKGRAA